MYKSVLDVLNLLLFVPGTHSDCYPDLNIYCTDLSSFLDDQQMLMKLALRVEQVTNSPTSTEEDRINCSLMITQVFKTAQHKSCTLSSYTFYK